MSDEFYKVIAVFGIYFFILNLVQIKYIYR